MGKVRNQETTMGEVLRVASPDAEPGGES